MARSQKIISKNMSKIHGSDTSIEIRLRKALWHRGYRYRKNYKLLPGSPDIVLTKSNGTGIVTWKQTKSSCSLAGRLSISGDRILPDVRMNVLKLSKKPSGIRRSEISNLNRTDKLVIFFFRSKVQLIRIRLSHLFHSLTWTI